MFLQKKIQKQNVLEINNFLKRKLPIKKFLLVIVKMISAILENQILECLIKQNKFII